MWRDINLKQPNELQVRNQWRYAALENLDDSEDMNRAWENIKENQNLS